MRIDLEVLNSFKARETECDKIKGLIETLATSFDAADIQITLG